ncbi:hypothetical protein D9619_001403 [Psilocybe cf. subviscida]|uniref:Tyrosine specific protein phosphatases domain-containing protein n=1 Tax=Psilocybe cf. subviscida TaxID=2480587 RepID=A0A8H5F2T9_9AGAR|nr:hypothetical protein D9619_001403 [Psilocybe cf. subviscida]
MSPNNITHDDEQLSLLASQHHRSEYNRSKFGSHGSPPFYLPLSLHLPEKFDHLRRRQLSAPQAYSWWPAPVPAQVISEPSFSIQDEIMDAMSEPIVLPQPIQVSISVRTSQTHPINISPIIPPNFVGPIASHALRATTHSPTFLDLPPAFFLDRLGIERDSRKSISQSSIQQIALPSIPNHFRTRSNVRNALEVAINSPIDRDGGGSGDMRDRVSGLAHKTTLSVALSLSSDRSRQVGADTNTSEIEYSLPVTPPLVLRSPEPPPHAALLASGMPMMIPPSPLYRYRDDTPIALGNLLLSSCPGKKVRLDGPVKGRSAVCRDLESDIKRIKELNVGCIICCLDDEELEFLGSPWSEYLYHTQKYGIDVLRMPIPEGLPPISAALLDKHLADVIRRYTLKGVSILVHCRGGVGRAGVIACCWMTRLGLCGWPIPEEEVFSPLSNTGWSAQGKQARIAFIERIIATLRKRRSMKAIETYEQVKFLLDYVEHLESLHGSLPHASFRQIPSDGVLA